MKIFRTIQTALIVSAFMVSTALAQTSPAKAPQIDTEAGSATVLDKPQLGTKPQELPADQQKLIATATELIKNSRFKEAYTLLTPYQSELAGEPDYDYLLGMSALDNDKPNEAIFALERVLAVNPNHLQARAEIARAYLATGELTASKQEFETVQQQNPPQEVSATIQKYLDIIETARSAEKTTIRGYLEAMVGEDSNVNAATGNRQIAVPAFGGLLMNLNDSGTAKRDTFGSLSTGFNIRHAVSPTFSLIAGANINKRNNSTQMSFNTANGDANFGAELANGDDSFMAILQAQNFVLDNKSYREAAGMTTQWQRKMKSGGQLSSYLQYSRLSYLDQKFRDADRYVLGGAYAIQLSGESAPVIYTGLYAGAEQPIKNNVSYLANTLYGFRIGGELKLNLQYTLLASASVENRAYDGKDSLFLVKRVDTQSDLKIGINYLPAKKWTISPSVSYTNNESNIIVNKYDRTAFSISVRRDFN